MSIHHLSFEDLLRICASLDDPDEINKMILALEIMERNLRYQRQRLAGMKSVENRQEEVKKQRERQKRKQSFKVLASNKKKKDTNP